MKIDENILKAANNINHMRERWNDTDAWHGTSTEPSFRNGKINIDTGDLEDVKTLLDWFEQITNVKLTED